MSNAIYKSSSHAVYSIRLHIVFVTKYRRPCITADMQNYLQDVFINIIDSWQCELISYGAESDHVHLVVDVHPALDISKLINNLKSASSRRVRGQFKEQVDRYYWKPYFWHRAYFVSSVGQVSLEKVMEYVEAQYIKPEDPLS